MAATGLAALATLLLASPALAQAYQCRLPDRVSVPRIAADAEPRRMPIAGYTLALSWSPEYCRDAGEKRASRLRQCNRRSGWFGLIVHGLWPDGPGNSWPQWCDARNRPSARALAPNMCMTPSARLLARQWAKHGSCLTRKPETYFRITRILWRSLILPDLDSLSRQDSLTAGDVRDAWVAANPHWPREGVSIQRDDRGWLEEIRLCYGKDWMPTPCKRTRRGARDETEIAIWRGL